jgi:hypothetical protein
MAQKFTSLDPAQPLSIGNVVSAALRLYAAHFKSYLKVSLIATLWAFVPLLVVGLIAGFFVVARSYFAALGLIIPAWLVLLFYCMAKFLAYSAAIARLAFGELTTQPETAVVACRFTNARMWRFLRTGFFVFGIFFGVGLLAYILLAILGIIAAVVLGIGTAGRTPDLQTSLILGLIALVLLLAVIAGFSWLAARLSITDVPLAVETNITAMNTVGRSWELTKTHALRIMAILFVAALVSLPLGIVSQIVISLMQALLAPYFASESEPAYGLIIVLMAYGLGLLTNVITIPFWQAIKGVIYYDLRCRREGLGLQFGTR